VFANHFWSKKNGVVRKKVSQDRRGLKKEEISPSRTGMLLLSQTETLVKGEGKSLQEEGGVRFEGTGRIMLLHFRKRKR